MRIEKMEMFILSRCERFAFLRDQLDFMGDDALRTIEAMGFLEAPASTRYHGAYDGGLFDHSYQVTKVLCELTYSMKLRWEDPRSPYLVGMMHDLCKADQYEKLEVPDENGVQYRYADTQVKGHGDKSVLLLEEMGIELTKEERSCILYHMGAFGDKDAQALYSKAVQACPNVLWTHTADMAASQIYGI